MWVNVYVYSCLYSFIQDIPMFTELPLHTYIGNVGECHAAFIFILCKFVFIELSGRSNQVFLVRKRESRVSREYALLRRRIDNTYLYSFGVLHINVHSTPFYN